MKGLFIKDLKLLANQKRVFLFAIAMMLIFVVTMDNPLFCVTYFTFFGALIAIGTLSYDEFNNGMSFMFTLPVTRREYVIEKFLFCILLSIVIWAVAIGLEIGIMCYNGVLEDVGEFVIQSLVGCIIASIIISIMLPLQIGLGQERSRTGIFILGGIFAVIVLILKLWVAPTDEQMDLLLADFVNLGLKKGMLFFSTGSIALLVISCLIAIGIINKKEY